MVDLNVTVKSRTGWKSAEDYRGITLEYSNSQSDPIREIRQAVVVGRNIRDHLENPTSIIHSFRTKCIVFKYI